MAAEAPLPPLPRPVAFWWARAPRAWQRVTPVLPVFFADGHFLSAFPRVATWAPPGALIVGLLVGWAHPGFDEVVTESVAILAVAAAIGALSTGLGAWLLLGFIAGDFLLAHPDWTPTIYALGEGVLNNGFLAGLLRIRIPLLIEYLSLAALIVGVPLAARTVIADLPNARRLRFPLSAVVAGTLGVIVVSLFALLWTQGAPLTIRPIFVWTGDTPPANAVSPLQEDGMWIARAAVIATALRALLIYRIESLGQLRTPVRAVEHHLRLPTSVVPATTRIPAPVQAALGGLLVTALLAGVIESWTVAVLMFAIFTAVQLMRLGVLRFPPAAWKTTIARVPMLVRLIVTFVVLALLAPVLIDPSEESFTSVAVFLIISGVFAYLMVPGPAPAAGQR